jgi:hypothetical protein
MDNAAMIAAAGRLRQCAEELAGIAEAMVAAARVEVSSEKAKEKWKNADVSIAESNCNMAHVLAG